MNYHVFHWWHRTFRDLRFVSQNIYIRKKSQEIFGELKADVKTGASKVLRPRPVLPSLLWPICQVYVHSQLSPTPPSPLRGRKKNVTKMNFSSYNDHSRKWIINDCYILFPSLRFLVFLFLRTSFFTAQHVGPMLQTITPRGHPHWRIVANILDCDTTICKFDPRLCYYVHLGH